MKADGSVDKKFLEFKTINHFLRDNDGDAAVEVMKCILVLWSSEDKSVSSFDVEAISNELKKLDEEVKQHLKQQTKRKEDGQEQEKTEESKSPSESYNSGAEIPARQSIVQ